MAKRATTIRTNQIALQAVTASELASSVVSASGAILGGAGAALSLNVDDSSIEISTNAVQIKALGITNAMLAGSIADGKLASDYIQTSEVDDSSIEFGASLNVKALGITNAMLAGSIAFSKMVDLTVSRALVSDGNGDVSVSAVTATELGYLDGVTSAIQTQLNALSSGYNRRAAVINIVDNTAVPPTEVSGDRYILDNTGASHANWDGAAANDIVEFNGTTWDAVTPAEGYVAYVDTSNLDALFVDDGSPAWETRSVLATALNDGKIFIGNVSNVAAEQTMSGDVTISNAGVTAIGATKVTNAMLAGSITDAKLDSDYIQTSEVDNSSIEFGASLNVKALGITNAMLAGSIADAKLASDYIQTSEVDGSSIEFNGGTLNVKALGIVNAMIANDTIQEPKINATNAPSNGQVLSYNSAGTNFTWIDAPTPADGIVEGDIIVEEFAGTAAQTVFNLANTPLQSSMVAFINAGYARRGAAKEYTVSGAAVTVLGDVLAADETLVVHYIIDN